MKLKWLLLVVVLIVGCGKNRPSVKWPAQVSQMEGFPSETQDAIRQTIAELNTQVGKTIISVEEGAAGAIRIIQVPELLPTENSGTALNAHVCQDVLARNTADAGNTSRIAGRATLIDDSCKVEISSFVNKEDGGELLESVLWHELGHCAGLQHDGQSGEIMYRTTTSFRKYQQAALQRFISTFLSAAGL